MSRVCLIVMDGWGINPRKDSNAVLMADLPNLNRLSSVYPCTSLDACGLAVGLPQGQMGNSEVGHLTIGSGRVIYQELTRITRAVETNGFEKNPVFAKLLRDVKNTGASLHIMGLVSDGGVHSHINHLFAILDATREQGLEKVFIHGFLDGRDTPPSSGLAYIKKLEYYLTKLGIGAIATISGRYFAMDRDKRWERVKKAYDAMTEGLGNKAKSAEEAVRSAYKRGETDEFVVPTVITETAGGPVAAISDGDSVLFFNFRADRAREITAAIAKDEFAGFERQKRPAVKKFVCMTEYDVKFNLPVMFSPQSIENILGEVVSNKGLKQFRVSETEKYAHVTFFFNGGKEEPFPGEDRLLIPSIKDVRTYDLRPEMRAHEIADAAVEKINGGDYSFMLMNFANPDMVGHTGVLKAAIKTCEAVDASVGKVVEAALKKGWKVIITADHGNAEQMLDYETNEPHTAHSLNPVPFMLIDDSLKAVALKKGRGLKDIAPTVLKLMGIEKPPEMQGEALF